MQIWSSEGLRMAYGWTICTPPIFRDWTDFALMVTRQVMEYICTRVSSKQNPERSLNSTCPQLSTSTRECIEAFALTVKWLKCLTGRLIGFCGYCHSPDSVQLNHPPVQQQKKPTAPKTVQKKGWLLYNLSLPNTDIFVNYWTQKSLIQTHPKRSFL